MSFESLGLAEPLVRSARAAGYRTPTPLQVEAIPPLMAGSDLFACAEMSMGKTAAFLLPLLHRLLIPHCDPVLVGQGLHGVRPLPISSPTRAPVPESSRGPRKLHGLILSPTREMASQIGEVARSLVSGTPLRVSIVYGGVNPWPQTQELRNGVDLMVATPSRLIELLTQGYVHLNHVSTFVVDEADRMLATGHLGDIRKIVQSLPPLHQTAIFSETVNESVEDLGISCLRHPVYVRAEAPNLSLRRVDQAVCFVSQKEKIRTLARLLSSQDVSRALVFTRTQQRADRVAEQLSRLGVRAEAIAKAARAKSSKKSVLVSTDLMAEGINPDTVSHVVNFDLPLKAEVYVDRVGKTGQSAISLCDEEERKLLKAIEKVLGKSLATRKIDLDQPAAPSTPPRAEPVAEEPAKAPAKPAADKASTEKPAVEKPAAEKASGERPAQKTTAEKLPAERQTAARPAAKPLRIAKPAKSGAGSRKPSATTAASPAARKGKSAPAVSAKPARKPKVTAASKTGLQARTKSKAAAVSKSVRSTKAARPAVAKAKSAGHTLARTKRGSRG